jgi:hypothetical protein
MSALDLLDPPDPTAWDAFLAETDGATVFHTSAWASTWTSVWQGSRWRALVWRQDGRIAAALGYIVRRGLLGRRLFSMPDGTYGGPVVRRGLVARQEAVSSLLGWYWALAEKTPDVHMAWRPAPGEQPPGFAEGFTQIVPLSAGYEAIMAKASHGTRSRVRQAEEAGLVLRPVTTEKGVRAYYDLVVRNAERHQSKPRPLWLYLKVLERMVPRGLARFDLIEHEARVIGGSLHLLYGGHALNWLTVADESRRDLHPNHYVIARWLRELSASGYREYDLGASPAEAKGLIEFKESWGAERRPVLTRSRRGGLYKLLRR